MLVAVAGMVKVVLVTEAVLVIRTPEVRPGLMVTGKVRVIVSVGLMVI